MHWKKIKVFFKFVILTYIRRNFDIVAMHLTNNKYMIIIYNSLFLDIDCNLMIPITCPKKFHS